MNDRRQFLKLLPVAAVTATTVRIEDVTAQMRELKPEKKYLVALPPETAPDDVERLSKLLLERFGPSVIVVAGDGATELKVYEFGAVSE